MLVKLTLRVNFTDPRYLMLIHSYCVCFTDKQLEYKKLRKTVFVNEKILEKLTILNIMLMKLDYYDLSKLSHQLCVLSV
jgi:hypothetical protein